MVNGVGTDCNQQKAFGQPFDWRFPESSFLESRPYTRLRSELRRGEPGFAFGNGSGAARRWPVLLLEDSYFNSWSEGLMPLVNLPKPKGVGLYSPTYSTLLRVGILSSRPKPQ